MSLKNSFPAQVAAVVACGLLVLAWPSGPLAAEDVRTAVAAGAAVSAMNVMLGYAAIRYAFDKSHSTFLKAVLGGMGLRLLFMLGAFAALLFGFRLHAVALTVSLLAFYAVFMVLEINFLQRRMAARENPTRT